MWFSTRIQSKQRKINSNNRKVICSIKVGLSIGFFCATEEGGWITDMETNIN